MYTNVLIIGYHEIACILFEELIRFDFDVKGVIVNPKRDDQIDNWYRDIKELARENGIKIMKPMKIKDNQYLYSQLIEMNLDIIFSAFSHFIFPEELLNLPKLGCFNFHNSALPYNRGRAAPIWAIIKGQKKTEKDSKGPSGSSRFRMQMSV